jgi:predicted transcriptional regulator
MGQSTTLTIRLDSKLKKKLDKLADSTKRSKSFLASEAIASFVEHNEWQIKEIKEGIKEADADDFASNEEVKMTFDKWSGNAS